MGEMLKEILFKFWNFSFLFPDFLPYLSLSISAANYQKYCCLNSNLFIHILLFFAGSNCQEAMLISWITISSLVFLNEKISKVLCPIYILVYT